MTGAQRQPLSDGRWHLQHGPIDIVIGADGEPAALVEAHEEAWQRFRPLLGELVAELPLLRRPVGDACPLEGPVAQRMWRACHPFRHPFITPMAAVAGAVAQELITFYCRPGITRAWVNNGGDIALHLAPEASLTVGLYADLSRLDVGELRNGLTLDGRARIDYPMAVRGIATSGWRGRSFSLGIADSVTVFARTAAGADAAATVIANAVDIADPRIVRRPASTLKDDSDIGDQLVTVDVPSLAPAAVRQALAAGHATAVALQQAGLIASCLLVCQAQSASTGGPDALLAGPDPVNDRSFGAGGATAGPGRRGSPPTASSPPAASSMTPSPPSLSPMSHEVVAR